MLKKIFIIALGSSLMMAACNQPKKKQEGDEQTKSAMQKKVEQYAMFDLKTNIDHLSDNQKKMLKIRFDVSDIMEKLLWQDAFGDKSELMEKIDDKYTKIYAEINYGPWDRLEGDKPFVEGYGEKPPGAQYYPEDITKEEFENWDNENKDSWYTMVRRDDEENLKTVWYHEFFPEKIEKAAK